MMLFWKGVGQTFVMEFANKGWGSGGQFYAKIMFCYLWKTPCTYSASKIHGLRVQLT